MDASLKKKLVMGASVVLGTYIFKRFLASPIAGMLPAKASA